MNNGRAWERIGWITSVCEMQSNQCLMDDNHWCIRSHDSEWLHRTTRSVEYLAPSQRTSSRSQWNLLACCPLLRSVFNLTTALPVMSQMGSSTQIPKGSSAQKPASLESWMPDSNKAIFANFSPLNSIYLMASSPTRLPISRFSDSALLF